MTKMLIAAVVVTVTFMLSGTSSASNYTISYFNPSDSDVAVFFNMTDNETLTDFMISVTPSPVHMFMDESALVNVIYTISCDSTDKSYRLNVYVTESNVVHMTQSGNFNISCNNTSNTSRRPYPFKDAILVTGMLNITLKSELIGRTWLIFETDGNNNSSPAGSDGTNITHRALDTKEIDEDDSTELHKHLIVVIRKPRPIDTIFRVVVYFFLVISTIGMGCKMEIDVVISVLKKPIAPGIGFCCQYLLMPLIAYAVAKLVKFQNPAVGLGIFASGICPGGGASNIYSYLLGGDISLSVTMTTISNIGALGMIPLWMFTLGQQFQDDKIQISVPYLDIIQTLALVILPLFVGIFIKYKFLKVAKVIIKILRPVTFVTIAIVLSFGIYANLYIFKLFKPSTFLAGCLLPYAGYILGGLTGLIFRQPWYRVKTIAIETGVQNTIVAYIMLLTALPPPDGDLAAVGPVASAVMTPIPLFVIALFYNIYLKCTGQDYDEVSKLDPDENGRVENGKSETKAKLDRSKKRKKGGKFSCLAKDENGEVETDLVNNTSSM